VVVVCTEVVVEEVVVCTVVMVEEVAVVVVCAVVDARTPKKLSIGCS
jgi:hypothetical protein